MSLDKAIMHHKEHRKPYGKYRSTFPQSIDCTCRNHGSCPWCLSNRTHGSRKREYAMKDALKEAAQAG